MKVSDRALALLRESIAQLDQLSDTLNVALRVEEARIRAVGARCRARVNLEAGLYLVWAKPMESWGLFIEYEGDPVLVALTGAPREVRVLAAKRLEDLVGAILHRTEELTRQVVKAAKETA